MPSRRILPTVLVAWLLSILPAFAVTEIPFSFRDGLIWLRVAAGQREPLHFLLDSGAGASVVDRAAALRLGLPLGQCVPVAGVHTRTVARQVGGFRGRVGGVEVPSSLLALDLSAPSRACHRRIDGLLGADFFRGRIVQIDYARETVRLLTEAEARMQKGEAVPLARRNDAWCVRIAVNGNASQWMRFDTGCNSALEWVVNGAGQRRASAPSIATAAGGPGTVRTDLALGNLRIPNVPTGLHASRIFPGEAGLLGNGLLSQFCVTVDFDRSRLFLRRGD